jgi:hypothetical protein
MQAAGIKFRLPAAEEDPASRTPFHRTAGPLMKGEDTPTTAVDARRAARETIETDVLLRFEAAGIEGQSDNMSGAGILFFTDQPIRCVVEVGRGNAKRRYRGRVVRLQRMNETNTGLAVEFELE